MLGNGNILSEKWIVIMAVYSVAPTPVHCRGINESQRAALRERFVRMSVHITVNGCDNGTLAIRDAL